MEQEIKNIQKEIQNVTDSKVEVSVLGEIVNSLVKAVSRLQTMKEVEMNATFKNMELSFPKEGVDFHRAKKLYEINLVKQALRHTKGHQTNAAKLLKMRTSTLNSIIKKYQIEV